MTCTFFGHRDTPTEIKSELKRVLVDLIVNEQADRFYVGYQGNFDRVVCNVLGDLKQCYPHIRCYIILAYLDITASKSDFCFETIYPEGLEEVPKRFAILARNKWMIEKSDCAITYVSCSFGGAAQFKELALKKNKKVIELTE